MGSVVKRYIFFFNGNELVFILLFIIVVNLILINTHCYQWIIFFYRGHNELIFYLNRWCVFLDTILFDLSVL